MGQSAVNRFKARGAEFSCVNDTEAVPRGFHVEKDTEKIVKSSTCDEKRRKCQTVGGWSTELSDSKNERLELVIASTCDGKPVMGEGTGDTEDWQTAELTSQARHEFVAPGRTLSCVLNASSRLLLRKRLSLRETRWRIVVAKAEE